MAAPAPYFRDVRCYACKAQLRISATRAKTQRSKARFKVPCPYCREEVRGEVPPGVLADSVQVVLYERPAESR